MIKGSDPAKLKRVGNHAMLTDRLLGKGHYGKVYLAYQLPNNSGSESSEDGGSVVSELLACKVIERGDKKFSAHAQQLVQNEITNLSLVRSPHVIALHKYYKTH
jgi:serine/threonine protein kinase